MGVVGLRVNRSAVREAPHDMDSTKYVSIYSGGVQHSKVLQGISTSSQHDSMIIFQRQGGIFDMCHRGK